MNAQTGTVLYGANNIFSIRPSPSAQPVECRIKGKILRNAEGDYNPLAPGDTVSFLHGGVLLERGPRKNVLLRWNKKGRAAQAIAANVDLLVCVSSPASPPFRPRFLDRLLIAAALAEIPALICMNKTDQALTRDIQARLDDFAARGIPVLRTCLKDGIKFGEGEAALRQALYGKRVVFVGQSGVGKTSLLNALAGENRKTGELSEKYNRGRHTTVLAFLAAWKEGEIIDTPGVREFEICGTDTDSLRFLFSEFTPFEGECRLSDCSHTHEPDCAVRAAAEEGRIFADRYESYLRIYDELLLRKRRSHE